MNEQGIAWMMAGGHHAPSPEESRYRALRLELARNQPAPPSIRDRLGAAIVAWRAVHPAEAVAVDCCAA